MITLCFFLFAGNLVCAAINYNTKNYGYAILNSFAAGWVGFFLFTVVAKYL